MKIADVCEFYAERGGGVKTYVEAKLRAAHALGHEVVVIAPGPRDAEEARAGGRIVWIASAPMPLDTRYYVLARQRAVHAVLDREQPDVLEGSSPWTSGLFAARWRGAALKSFVFHQDPVAVYGHTALDRVLSEARVDRLCGGFFAYVRALSRRFDLTLTGGDWLSERLRAQGVHAPHAVPFGVDKRVFRPRPPNTELRARLLSQCGLSESAKLLVCVSRHHPEKRIGTLVSAIAALGSQAQVGLVICGDGPLRRLTELRASRARNVHVRGAVPPAELSEILSSADALVHGSAAETFGLAVAEALCVGLPLVVPDRGGARSLAAPEHSERYAPGDAESCAQAIARLLARDLVALRAAALAASEHVPSAQTHFERLFALYAERLALKSRAQRNG